MRLADGYLMYATHLIRLFLGHQKAFPSIAESSVISAVQNDFPFVTPVPLRSVTALSYQPCNQMSFIATVTAKQTHDTVWGVEHTRLA
jgi:hypothetical protein